MDNTDGGTLQAADKMFAILDVVRELDGGRVTEIAEETEFAKSTTHRHLTSLVEHQLVVKRGGVYQIGLKFLGFGEHARTRHEAYELAVPLADDLAEQTDERALFMVEEHGHAVYLYRALGNHAVKTDSSIGTVKHLHSVAGGKAMLANLPKHRVESIVDQWGLPAETENTITDRRELYDELETIRERGYAFNDEETIEGLRAVAVPILGLDDTVYGAFTVSGPTHRVQGEWFEEGIPNLLLGTANELEINLKYN